jgi:hypothetical protein
MSPQAGTAIQPAPVKQPPPAMSSTRSRKTYDEARKLTIAGKHEAQEESKKGKTIYDYFVG